MNKDNPKITIEDIINEINYLTDEEIDKLKSAYDYAEELHKNQKRLTGDPYIKHLLNVVHILITLNADSDTLIAGMLHDAISIGGIKEEDIKEKFGDDVAMLVSGVTQINRLNYNGTNETAIANHRKILVGLTKDVRVNGYSLRPGMTGSVTDVVMMAGKRTIMVVISGQVFKLDEDQVALI